MIVPKIIDHEGQERDWDWFVTNFGAITIERCPATEGKVFRIVKLRDSIGPAVQIASVRDEDSMPLIGVNLVRFWPDAPELPQWPAPISMWRRRGVIGPTNEEGNVGFGMGHGDYYFAPNAGASALWVADGRGPSDFIIGLGMLGGTDHRHVDVFFQLVDLGSQIEPPVPPKPVPSSSEDWRAMLARLDRIIELLEKQIG